MRPNEQSKSLPASRLGRLARERAEREARHVPWQRLLEARTQYIDWQEFQFWVRSILEVEDRIPEWMVKILGERCPGFVDSGEGVSEQAQGKPLALRLEDWIDDHIFSFAKKEGWLNAITFYALRDPRCRRAEVCWSESVAQWRAVKPPQYPTFEEWTRRSASCDDAANLVPEMRKIQEKANLVSRERLAAVVADYIDWEAFAYWARPALELETKLPAVVERELGLRCPGFLEVRSVQEDEFRGKGRTWDQLMGWIVEHYFRDANMEGWFDAILVEAHNHPRAIRTMEYSDRCEELWKLKMPVPYPSFEDWRRASDSHTENGHS